jgi:2-oxoisovalerate dehydrogenase E1 component alpha subunit
MLMALGLTPREFALGLMGKRGEPNSGGRQMPSHWSLRRVNVVSHSSPVATQTPHASGIALGIKLRGGQEVVLTSIGEGSTSQGEWYEGVNWAAVHKLPVVFLVENNTYAISVREEMQMAVPGAAGKAAGLGLPGVSVDGLDIVAVHQAVAEAVERARRGQGPTVVEPRVHRLTPHSSDDDDRSYRSRSEIEAMKADDPLAGFQKQLLATKVVTPKIQSQVEAEAMEAVDDAIRFAEAAPYPDVSEAAYPVYVEDVRRG